MKNNKAIWFLLLLITFINACKKDDVIIDDNDNKPPVKTERELILEDYTNNYEGSAVTNFTWTGDATTCFAGTESTEATTKTLQRINYFRRMAGLNDDIAFDASKSAKCQQAALMIRANNALDHYPPTSWSCYTADGYEASGSSNIALGTNSSTSISRYIQDDGANNTAVGHRRWILYSKAKVMGTGSTPNSNALWVLGNSSNPLPSDMPEFIAWPPKGLVPAPIVYPRWSLSVPSADFTNAQVNMTDGAGNPLSLNIIARNGNYGDKSIVWEPEGINTTSSGDVTYNVSITDVLLGGVTKTYSYQVIIIQP
ncbi:MAG: CAP domain-containing protein [Bacteroidales bacterium]|nr:CAP domain-containing protein [Bacteroidales bacterium]